MCVCVGAGLMGWGKRKGLDNSGNGVMCYSVFLGTHRWPREQEMMHDNETSKWVDGWAGWVVSGLERGGWVAMGGARWASW